MKNPSTASEDSLSEFLPPTYHHQTYDEEVYAMWQKLQCFKAGRAKTEHTDKSSLTPPSSATDSATDKNTEEASHYSIVLPPPNITGRLHMGHALNGTLQDLIIRYKRMCHYDVLWLPGIDHAGIATQTVVKKMLDAKGIDYRDIGRKAFTDHVFAWKEKYGDHIIAQFKHLGCSFDTSRLCFTMDSNLVTAVNTAFKRLYDEGLIYKGKRIVNWCPIDKTALSDDEVEFAPGGELGYLINILYPFADKIEDSHNHDGGTQSPKSSSPTTPSIDGDREPLQGLIVSTTRPETLFGDVAVAVHPEDKRYRAYVGKKVRLPLTGREIPIIADAYVKRDFGTGCLKITPAHDKNDFEIGERHNLPLLNVMNEDATMNDAVPSSFQGLSREICRNKVIAALEKHNLLVRKIPYQVPLGRSYRSKAIIEYRVSEQWFVKMKPLVKKLLAAPEKLKFYPPRIETYYNSWLSNIKDWCISRQIWWGHQIPAWTCKKAITTPNGRTYNIGAILVGIDEADALRDIPDNKREHWRREEDVLDTWFSSALWPFSTLGWPDETAVDFKRYFPTTTLSTAKDIIFFWVARMAILSYHFIGKLPFKNVNIHPTILDDKGRTMSKSKGNGIDPYHVIRGATVNEMKQPIFDARPSDMNVLLENIEKEYKDGFPGIGADALRYTLLYLLTPAQSIQISMNNFLTIGRRFTTKFWNIARFVFMKLDATKQVTHAYATRFPDEIFSQLLTYSQSQSSLAAEGHQANTDRNSSDSPTKNTAKNTDNEHLTQQSYKVFLEQTIQRYCGEQPPSSTSEAMQFPENIIEEYLLGRWEELPLEDQWIECECFQTITHIHKAYETFDFSNMGAIYYQFIWTNLCDHYLEMLKQRLPAASSSKDSGAKNSLSKKELHRIIQTLVFLIRAFKRLLILTHPVMPFMTEHLWGRLRGKLNLCNLPFLMPQTIPLIVHPFLMAEDFRFSSRDETNNATNTNDANNTNNANNANYKNNFSELFAVLKEMIGAVRALRKRYNIHLHTPLRVKIETTYLKDVREEQLKSLFETWMYIIPTEDFTQAEKDQAITLRSEYFTLYVDVSAHIDPESERNTLIKEQAKCQKALLHVKNRLANKDFMAKARPELIAGEKTKAAKLEASLKQIERELAAVCS